MLINLFVIALIILFAYVFIVTTYWYQDDIMRQYRKERAERDLASRFISIAIKQRELRLSDPVLANAYEMSEVIDEQDRLVAEYLEKLSKPEESSNITSLAARRLMAGNEKGA